MELTTLPLARRLDAPAAREGLLHSQIPRQKTTPFPFLIRAFGQLADRTLTCRPARRMAPVSWSRGRRPFHSGPSANHVGEVLEPHLGKHRFPARDGRHRSSSEIAWVLRPKSLRCKHPGLPNWANMNTAKRNSEPIAARYVSRHRTRRNQRQGPTADRSPGNRQSSDQIHVVNSYASPTPASDRTRVLLPFRIVRHILH